MVLLYFPNVTADDVPKANEIGQISKSIWLSQFQKLYHLLVIGENKFHSISSGAGIISSGVVDVLKQYILLH